MSKTKQTIELSRSNFAEEFLYLKGQPFSLDHYPFLRTVYDRPLEKDLVLKFSRQCVLDEQIIHLADGSPKLAKDLFPGDPIIGFDTVIAKNVLDRVKNVWDNGIQPVYEITTRTGRCVKVTDNHPFRKIDRWIEAQDLIPGDLIALSRDNSCSLSKEKTIENWEYTVAAYLLAEGSISSMSLGFTNCNSDYVSELENALKNIHQDITLHKLPEKYKGQYRINGLGSGTKHPVKEWLIGLGMYGKTSAYKSHPDFVWNLTKDQICDYLRIWWNTDGYWSINKIGSHCVGIGLISKELVYGIQRLLLKLGIHSVIRTDTPEIYKNTDKEVFTLTVEGQYNIKLFNKLIQTDKGPKKVVYNKESHNKLVMDKQFVNSQLDTLDKKYRNSVLYKTQNGTSKTYSFEKVHRMCEVADLPELQKIIDGDIYFDKVKSVEYIGDLSTTAIETELTHTFQIEGLPSANTSKSTTLANFMIIDSAMIPHLHSLYVAPTSDQTKIFSHDRFRPVMEGSPLISENYIDSSVVQNVFQKTFLNGSTCYLRYSLLSADRLRGISADINIFDEAQDLRSDNLPVIKETMSRSEIKRTIMSGTPKRTQGTLADAWNNSTMNEFILRCEACNHWNILGEANIGLEGVICERCGGPIDVSTGQWVSNYGDKNKMPSTEGYRVCLLHFARAPWVNWQKDVIAKYEGLKKSYFYNEVLALEYDEGASPLTLQEIKNACDPGKVNDTTLSSLEKSYINVMGIDYGPINSEESHTVVSVVQIRNGIAHVIYAKKFAGKEADFSFIHKEVPRLMEHFNVHVLAADYGMGEASNSEIRSKVGVQKVIAFQHMPTQKEKIRWNPKMPAYTLNRTQVITEFFSRVKKGKIIFPCWEDIQEQKFHKDLLNTQMEFDEGRNLMKYVNIGPDDFLHATLYAVIAQDLFQGVAQ